MPPALLHAPSPSTAGQTSGNVLRWNPSLSKAFDVAQEQFPAASAEEALVSKYLGVEIKHLERRKAQVMSVRMGAFLTAVNRELGQWFVDDVRNLDWQGRETTPLYETIQLNSKTHADFLVDGMRFLRRADDGSERRATFRVQPRWYGLDVTAYGLRAAGTAEALLARIRSAASDINFLAGEAFSLSGEFLPKTQETFADLFLDTANAAAVARIVKLVNERGKALENRGVLLMGPPGTGKTLSARIVRNLATATFIWVSSRDFHYAGSFGGFTEAFDLARECAPSVIVFEDVDNWLYDTTVDLLKSEMDGVARTSGVVTMLTTNHPELLPAALIDRPGRFHDVLRFGLPDAAARKAMLDRWLPELESVDATKAVAATDGYSGAHVRELARFARIIAEQDGLSLSAALVMALKKLAEQRDLITQTQRGGSRYRMPSELVGKVPVRLGRRKDLAEKGESLDRVYRAFADLHIKTINVTGRRFSGMATTPKPDRVGDVIEPLGVEFQNPLPLLLFHDNTMPVGTVTFGRPTSDGVPFEAVIPEVSEPGRVKDLTDQAAHFVKYKLIRSVSIGFRAFMEHMEAIKDAGWRFLKTEVFELSLVPIPANPDAMIHASKAIARPVVAASSHSSSVRLPGSGGSDFIGVAQATQATKGAVHTMKTIQEQIQSFHATRQAKSARMNELMSKAAESGATLDAEQSEEYDGLDAEIKAIDAHMARLEQLEKSNKAMARSVVGDTVDNGSASRAGVPVVRSRETLPPGIGFARAVKAAVVARLEGRNMLQVAKEMYPSDDRLHGHVAHVVNMPQIVAQMKATVPAGTTAHTDWASALVDPTNLAGEFIEYLRPETILGRLNLRRIPFNVRMIEQTIGGIGYWVGQGAPKPLTGFGFAPVTMPFTKVAAISVITEELARFSTPSAEMLVRDGLRDALVERMDRDLLDPAEAGTVDVQPASLTFGLVALSSAGVSADHVRTDLANLVQEIRSANLRGPIVLVMPDSLVTALTFMVNALGQPEFPDLSATGGTIRGLRVVASEYVANASGAGNMVVAIAEREVFLADDDQVTVDASREASLQMLDNPTNNSATGNATQVVSMWQTDSIALRAHRYVNWKKRRAAAVAYMDDVNWGSVGSPQ